jgi:formamidopyrimidine-DNA glycosylase
MPELPEVESIVRQLQSGHRDAPPLPGMAIAGVTLRWPRHIAAPSEAGFRRRLRGRTIQEVSRRGKYLVFRLDQGFLLIHLKMSGDLIVQEAHVRRDRSERTVFRLGGGWELRFNDARKFGKVFLVDDPDEILGPLGPEPLDPRFTPAALQGRLAARRRVLKPLLLDQTFLAGLGNIYADEALYRARLHPRRMSHSLTTTEAAALWKGIRASLRSGLRHNGASIDWVYRGGDFQNYFRVYGRDGEPCRSCGTSIERIVLGQRSAHFCPRCQPERPT